MESFFNIVVVGKTGNGKSSTANTLCGEHGVFPSSDGHLAETEQMKMNNCVVPYVNPVTNVQHKLHLGIIDTPGCFDTEHKEREIDQEVQRTIFATVEGIDAFLLCTRYGERFSDHEKRMITKLTKIMGKNNMNPWLYWVFTHYDGMKRKSGYDRGITELSYLREKLHKGAKDFINQINENRGVPVFDENGELDPSVQSPEEIKIIFADNSYIENLNPNMSQDEIQAAIRNEQQRIMQCIISHQTAMQFDKYSSEKFREKFKIVYLLAIVKLVTVFA